MAGFTEGFSDVEYLGFLVLALITLVAGLVIHSFIIGVNVTDWWKGRSVTPVDHVVTSLGISRMCTQCLITLYLFVDKLFQGVFNSYGTLLLIDIFLTIFFYANVWLTSLLSIVFCLKISNFHSRLLLYLRGVIEHRTVYFIVVSALLSAVSSLMLFYTAITHLTKSETYNKTMYSLFINCTNNNYIYIYISGTFFPLLFYIISSILLFCSLYHHTAKMKMTSNLSINLETYYSVMRFVSFTFMYNTIYFIGQFNCALYYFLYCMNLAWLYTVVEFLPVLHSSYLIYRTAKLRSQMAKVLQNVTDFLLQRKETETRENIEMHFF